MLQESNIDMLGTCETFLSKTNDDKIVNINGFTIERKGRDSCPGIKTNTSCTPAEKAINVLLYNQPI